MRPSYFDPAAQPDTETQYRRGGKVNKMQKLSVAKKMPRKFGEGGVANPTDKMTPDMRAKMKAEADAAKTDADQTGAMKKFYENQNRLGPRPAPVKKAKGGTVKKVRKFADGGETDASDKDVSATHRFMEKDPDVYARARKFVESGSGETKKFATPKAKAGSQSSSASKTSGNPNPVSYPKSAASKGSSSYSNEGRRMTDNQAAGDKQTSDDGLDVNSRLKKAFSNFDMGYLTRPNKALYKKGGKVSDATASKDKLKSTKGYAKGGNVDSTVVKGSYTQGPKRVADDKTNAKSSYLQAKQNPDRSEVKKFAKGGKVSDASASKDKLKPTKGYAKGGMARGYGISKVTNRTKVC